MKHFLYCVNKCSLKNRVEGGHWKILAGKFFFRLLITTAYKTQNQNEFIHFIFFSIKFYFTSTVLCLPTVSCFSPPQAFQRILKFSSLGHQAALLTLDLLICNMGQVKSISSSDLSCTLKLARSAFKNINPPEILIQLGEGSSSQLMDNQG